MRIEEWCEREQEIGRRLCQALGLDPARVIAFEALSNRPDRVRVVIYDGPTPDDRHTEDHKIPEDWGR